jgi:serine/threonine-protein kinase
VALKVLPWADASSDHRKRRFLREARSAAAATHACIAAVHEIGEADGYAFIAMELVRGMTLRTRLERGISIAESVRIMRDVARGLAKAHESGVVHRDLKPENVMLTNEGEVKILDFGLAKLRSSQTSDYPPASMDGETVREVTTRGEVMGTVPYMSPEQARGDDADARSDVFSFGTMLYEMLAGTRPFQGGSVFAVLFAVSSEEATPVERVNPDVPPDLAKLVARCHMKNKLERYASGRELVEALDQCVPGDLDRRDTGSVRRYSIQPTRLLSQAGMGLEMASTLAPGASVAPPPVAPPSSSARPRRWIAFGGGVAALGAIVVGFFLRTEHSPTNLAPSEGASVSRAAAPSHAQALEAYAHGNEAFRAGDPDLAMADWERAATIDPDLCPAHLRIAANQDSPNVRAREELEKVRRCDARLDPSDRAFEEVVAAFVDPSVSTSDKVAAATRAANAFPKSAELAYFLGSYLGGDSNAPAEALRWIERTIDIDPTFASAYVRRAEELRFLGRPDEGRASLDACFKQRPDAPVCAGARFNDIARGGRCGDAETYVRGLIARRPSAPYAYDMLARLLIGTAASTEAIDRVEAQADALRPVEDAPTESMKLRRRRQECVVDGDFTCALYTIDKVAALESARIDASTVWQRTFQASRSYREMGRMDAAKAVVSKFFDSLPSFEVNDDWTVSDAIDAHQVALELGIRTRAELDLVGESSMKSMPVADPFDRWTIVRLSGNPTPEEAKEDLAVAPPMAVLEVRRPTVLDIPNRAFRVGMAFLRTGSPAIARPWLEQATRACVWDWRTDPVMPDQFAFPQVQAYLAVGEAREATGDKAGAREAYREVLRRWGDAKPKSVTADEARARLAALGK